MSTAQYAPAALCSVASTRPVLGSASCCSPSIRNRSLWFVESTFCVVPQGDAIERFAQMTNWDYYEAARRFQKVLEASGINAALVARDIQDGDSVVIGEMELEWSHDQVSRLDRGFDLLVRESARSRLLYPANCC